MPLMAGIGVRTLLGLPAQVGGAVAVVPELVAGLRSLDAAPGNSTGSPPAPMPSHTLVDVAEPLQGAAERVGRNAARLPAGRAAGG